MVLWGLFNGVEAVGSVQRGRSWVNNPKTLNRARTVRAPCDNSPNGPISVWSVVVPVTWNCHLATIAI